MIYFIVICLLGDGVGVGKGRILVGIIYENYLLGRKRVLWLVCLVFYYYFKFLYRNLIMDKRYL